MDRILLKPQNVLYFLSSEGDCSSQVGFEKEIQILINNYMI